MSIYEGLCHCGAIGFAYSTQLRPENWSVRACQCRFCRTHAALSTSDRAGELRFRAADPGRLRRYRFAFETADFLLCGDCGVYVGAVAETPRGSFGIVNTRALTETPAGLAAPAAISYDGETRHGRIDRRSGRWTPVFEVPR